MPRAGVRVREDEKGSSGKLLGECLEKLLDNLARCGQHQPLAITAATKTKRPERQPRPLENFATLSSSNPA